MNESLVLRNLLLREVVPTTGCTEIGAVALAAGWAVRALTSQDDGFEEIQVEVDENTYKNGLGVGVPGTGESGLALAAAMGAHSSRRVDKGLQILENPDAETIKKARVAVSVQKVQVIRAPRVKGIWIEARVRNGLDEATAIIEGSHDHLVKVNKNGVPYEGAPASDDNLWEQTKQIKALKYREFIEFVERTDLGDLPILEQAMDMNMHFVKEALRRFPSLKIGGVIRKYMGKGETGEGLSGKIQFVTASAVEARMKGFDLPVMACGGSGNQGLVATIPVVETARRMGASKEQTLRALALSYLTTIYIKAYTGLLSPICGCGVAAAVGAGCGIVFLLGGGAQQIEAQINNMVGAMAGIICDGAKSGCSLKALMAVGLAVDSSYLSMENIQIPARDGIMGMNVMETLQNLQKIIETGMPSMDTAIVDVMEGKKTVQ